jgi:hypothetical protein
MTTPQHPTEGTAEDFFDGVGGGGAPGFKFGPVGSGIRGTVVEQYRTTVRDTSGTVKTYSDGRPIPQLNVTLQTDLREWAGCAKVPVDPETQQPKPASEDDGLRRVFVKYDMRRAIGVALQAAGRKYLETGGQLAIKHSGDKPTGQPNPLPLYEARYKPPTESEGFFAEGQQAPAQQDPFATAAPATPPPAAPATPPPAAPVAQQDPFAASPPAPPAAGDPFAATPAPDAGPGF